MDYSSSTTHRICAGASALTLLGSLSTVSAADAAPLAARHPDRMPARTEIGMMLDPETGRPTA